MIAVFNLILMEANKLKANTQTSMQEQMNVNENENSFNPDNFDYENHIIKKIDKTSNHQ